MILAVFSDTRSVFTLNDIAMLIGESDFKRLNERLNYHVHNGKLLRPRKGIYVKPGYDPEEMACTLYTPSYISLEYVLQKAGVVFQYDERITSVGYLSRSLEVDGRTYAFRKIKGEIMVATRGITQRGNINVATPERAFLDLLYLNREYYFDNLALLDKEFIYKLLPVYNSKTLTGRVEKFFSDDRRQ
ncbi:MAG: hypothetical protein LBH06_00510 [Rikenellaceae bacterium]|nr:hypothetical protein [Rikenellaceae bacterium]